MHAGGLENVDRVPAAGVGTDGTKMVLTDAVGMLLDGEGRRQGRYLDTDQRGRERLATLASGDAAGEASQHGVAGDALGEEGSASRTGTTIFGA